MMVTCTICKKSFKNTQGLRGHNFFVHPNNDDICSESIAQLAEKSSVFSLVPVSTEHRFSSLERRLAMLEQATGVLQADEPDKVLNNNRKPLLEQMTELTEQLNELISSSINYAELSPALEQLGELAQQLNSQDASHSSMMTALGNIENQLNTKVDQEMFSHLQIRISSIEKWKTEIDNLLMTMQKAQTDNQQQFARVITSVADKLARVEILMRRFPTGEIVAIQLSDNREHHFREYKRSDGLAQPHRTKYDLILGERWIDLAEPED